MHSLGLCSRFDGENDDCQCDRYYAHDKRFGLCSLCVKKCLTTKKNTHENLLGVSDMGMSQFIYIFIYTINVSLCMG